MQIYLLNSLWIFFENYPLVLLVLVKIDGLLVSIDKKVLPVKGKVPNKWGGKQSLALATKDVC